MDLAGDKCTQSLVKVLKESLDKLLLKQVYTPRPSIDAS